MLTLGIIFGLLTAVLQATAYLFSRRLVSRGFSLIRLLVMSHVVMAVAAGPVLLFIWPTDMPPMRQWLGLVAAVGGTYLLGQVGLFYALRHTEASRVAPLLGLKIIVLALLAMAVLDLSLSPMQWGAVILATAAAFVLNKTGGTNPPKAVIAVIFACFCYSLSDLSITELVPAVRIDDSRIIASIRSTVLVYVLLGLVALPMLRWYGSAERADWRGVVPYSFAWLGSMFCLFGAIALVDVVAATILQSTRGIIGVVLGAIVAAIGHVHLEKPTTRSVFVRRAVAAAMMTLAVAFYIVGRSAT
jgi:drug/metabolite transporter (DMT)-like permease